MIVPRYVPGQWFAVVTDGTVALLAPQTMPAVVTEVWEALRAGSTLDSQLETLTSGHLGVLPPFALVSVTAGVVRGYLRGDVELETAGGTLVPGSADPVPPWPGEHRPDGVVVHTGISAQRWVAVEVQAPDAMTVRVSARQGGGQRTAHELPVLSGVVTAGLVSVVLHESAAAAPEPVASSAHPGAPVAVDGEPDDVVEFDEELFGQTVLDPASLARREAVATAPVAAQTPAPPPAPGPAAPPAAGPDPLQAPAPAEVPVPAEGPAPSEAPAPAEVPAPAPAEAPADVDAATSPRAPVLSAVPPPPILRPVPASAVRLSEEDHDGLTIMSSDLVEIRKQLPSWTGQELPGPFAVPTEVAPAKLVLSSGQVVNLDRTILIGRAPIVSRVSNRDLPRLVTVESPNHDISRTHAQVKAEGDRVFVTDLDSTNGVLLALPGEPPARIRTGVPTVLPVGATVDIGDGVTFQVVRN